MLQGCVRLCSKYVIIIIIIIHFIYNTLYINSMISKCYIYYSWVYIYIYIYPPYSPAVSVRNRKFMWENNRIALRLNPQMEEDLI